MVGEISKRVQMHGFPCTRIPTLRSPLLGIPALEFPPSEFQSDSALQSFVLLTLSDRGVTERDLKVTQKSDSGVGASHSRVSQ